MTKVVVCIVVSVFAIAICNGSGSNIMTCQSKLKSSRFNRNEMLQIKHRDR